MIKSRVVLAGGNGFLGRMLAADLMRRGFEVVSLARRPGRGMPGIIELGWDGKHPGKWMEAIDGSRVVINLAGRSVYCRYNMANRLAILNSRVDSTRVLGQVIQKCRHPPSVWLNSSTATIYKHSLERPMDESG